MKIIATYDMTLNLGSGPEPVLRGQEIEPRGTGVMSRAEHAASLIRRGAAVLPDNWPKYKALTDAKRTAALALVDRANRGEAI